MHGDAPECCRERERERESVVTAVHNGAHFHSVDQSLSLSPSVCVTHSTSGVVTVWSSLQFYSDFLYQFQALFVDRVSYGPAACWNTFVSFTRTITPQVHLSTFAILYSRPLSRQTTCEFAQIQRRRFSTSTVNDHVSCFLSLFWFYWWALSNAGACILSYLIEHSGFCRRHAQYVAVLVIITYLFTCLLVE